MCPTQDSTAAAEQAVVHDIDVPRTTPATRVTIVVMLVPVGIAFVIVLTAVFAAAAKAGAVAPTVGTLAALSAAVAIWWFAVVRKPRAHREIDARLNAVDAAGALKALQSHLRRHSADLNYHAKLMLGSLARRGHVGITVRACDEDKRQEIEPIDVRFEPIPLNEADPSFAELQSGFRPAGLPYAGSSAQQADAADLRRTFRRNLRFAGGWLPLFVFVLTASNLASQLASGASIGRVDVCLMIMAGLLLLSVGGRGAWRSAKQWLLVPGGVVARKPARKKSQWQVHLFDRRRSVLLVRQQNRNIWSVGVADGDGEENAFLTQVEAYTLLRAWLSPLAPPPVEQLSDLE